MAPCTPGPARRLQSDAVPLNRDFGNVWDEICARARALQASRTPVETLAERVANYIVEVTQDRIVRSSQQARTEDASVVPRREFERIWAQLARDGETTGVVSLRFAYALMLKCLDGLDFVPVPFGLIV